MPPFNHVHMLTETVKTLNQVACPTKCLNIYLLAKITYTTLKGSFTIKQ